MQISFFKNFQAALKNLVDNDIFFGQNAGAPTDGTSGTGVNIAGPGSLLFDRTNKQLYINNGTKASPTWIKFGGSQSLNGVQVDNEANNNVIGAIPVVHRIVIAAGANADTDIVLTHKTRVLDVIVLLTGAGVASAIFTVKNVAAAITNGIAASGADQTITRAGTIDDANFEVAAGAILRVTGSAGATQPNAIVYVIGVRAA